MQEEDKPVDREAWRRVLAEGAAEPPRATDERIRARARSALAPHTGRWWLPASLAASLLLAVLVVQWQYEETGSPVPVMETDVAPAADEAATAAPAEEMYVPPPMMDHPAQPATLPPAEAPAVTGPAATAPAAGKPAAPATLEREADARNESAAAPTQVPKADSEPTAGFAQRKAPSVREVAAEQALTPEEWYARIEELRAAGRTEDANAELRRLEEAHPGWLENHLRNKR